MNNREPVTNLEFISAERFRRGLRNACKKIYQSKRFPQVNEIYLYGSCARNEMTFDSDIDLFCVLRDGAFQDGHRDLVLLKGELMYDEDLYVDPHFTVGTVWENSDSLYHRNIQEEGVLL